MIKQGRNIITCDQCKEEIKLRVQSKHLKGGNISLNYFRCKCTAKYLIDVTDKTTRQKQIELSLLMKYKADLMKVINAENLERIEAKTKDIDDKTEVLLKEIKEAKAELKAKYEGEL